MTQRNPSHNVHSHGQKQQQSNVQFIHFFTFIQESFPWRLLDSLELEKEKEKHGKIENNIAKPKSYALLP